MSEIKSFDEWQEVYTGWKKELLSVAINQFEYKESVIKPNIEADEYIKYFEEDISPFNTMQLSERDGI